MHDQASSNWRRWRITANPPGPHDSPAPHDRAKLPDRTGPDGIRWALVNRIRAEIAAGTYDSDEKFAIAEERLIARLTGE